MSNVLLLTAARESAAEILPSLSLLDHAIRIGPPSGDVLLMATFDAPEGARPDAVLVDARRDLVRVKELLRQVTGTGTPVLAIISEGAWAAVSPDWGADDVILNTAGPGEVEARIRIAIGRAAAQHGTAAEEVRSGELAIEEATYSARIRGVALDLTFKEFELLKFLAQHPRRVFSRSQLLQEVWGYDYFGGTRTVDVHVRRLRAKLGPENEALIGTVRNVGYKFVPAKHEGRRSDAGKAESGGGARAARPDATSSSLVGDGAARSEDRGSRSSDGHTRDAEQRARSANGASR
ncbi:MAG: winged helix-turn-helix transcriptional regulator [Streptosporangiaceae bacterium]